MQKLRIKMEKQIVTIIGSGLVGKSWAMLFASGGHEVRVYDSIHEVLQSAVAEIHKRLLELEKSGNLKNSANFSASKQLSLVTGFGNLKDALRGATYIQECTPETLEMKRFVFAQIQETLLSIGNDRAIIGSSSSAIPSSAFASDLDIKNRVLVAHPINPPYFVRLVEVVPNPWTSPDVTQWVRTLMTSLGQKPIVLKKEASGFALNRVQYAILNSTWKLISDGILSVEDADTVTREGLAPRYVFMGPLETAQLNAEGFLDYCQRYGSTIHEISVETQSEICSFKAEDAKEIDEGLQNLVSNSTLPQRRQWRDQNLAKLSQFKNNLSL